MISPPKWVEKIFIVVHFGFLKHLNLWHSFLSLGLTGDLTAVKNIDEESIKLLTPDLLLMVNHKNESIRSIGKNIFQGDGCQFTEI